MSKGVLYCMTTSIPDVVKIGKPQDFTKRMADLEANGYKNFSGLKKCIAIIVDDYDIKERMIHDLLSKNRINTTECFAINHNLVKQLFTSLSGEILYIDDFPITKSKLTNAEIKSKELEIADKEYSKISCIPDGFYYLKQEQDSYYYCDAILRKVKDTLYLCKGSKVYIDRDNIQSANWSAIRNQNNIDSNGVVLEDIQCNSVSQAAAIVKGEQANGWLLWKTIDGVSIDSYRT